MGCNGNGLVCVAANSGSDNGIRIRTEKLYAAVPPKLTDVAPEACATNRYAAADCGEAGVNQDDNRCRGGAVQQRW